MENRRVVLASRPEGAVSEDNFRIESAPLPKCGEGEVLVRHLWLSLDPYMRGRMSDAKSYVKGVELGATMVGQTAGEVLESKNDKMEKGDKVLTQLGWQLYGCTKEVNKIDGSRAPLTYYLGILGMPGETVVVSAASGAVGSVVGQLAKIWGCRAVGIAGGRQKCEYVTRELGFDACVDYKAGNLHRDLQAACPKGADVYFDNVGGEILDTVLRLTNLFARIVVCGMIAEYSATQPYAVRSLRFVLINRIKMQGMIVYDWKERYGEALKALGEYFAQGKLKYRESIVEGLENAPKGLIALLRGQNFGKQLVKLA